MHKGVEYMVAKDIGAVQPIVKEKGHMGDNARTTSLALFKHLFKREIGYDMCVIKVERNVKGI
jgi:hypothetical protein